jgi:tRNA threonylcarbamoyladenosine biosynthesis protein TsaE
MTEGLRLISHSALQTQIYGETLGSDLDQGDVLCLVGDLGAGKTCFIQGLAKGIPVSPGVAVTSPSFTLLNIYPGRVPLYHFDFYRMVDLDEAEAIGYRDFLGGNGISVIEWADRIPEVFPETHLRIDIQVDHMERRLAFHPVGDRYIRLIQSFSRKIDRLTQI